MTQLVNMIDKSLNFNENTIRVIGTDENPWFVAKDVCDSLGLKNITHSLLHIPENERGLTLIKATGGNQNFITISQHSMYKLLMKSNKPAAQNFQDYVCREILPSIEKTGKYRLGELCNKLGDSEKSQDILETKEYNVLRLEFDTLTEKFNKLELEKNKVIETKENEIKSLIEKTKQYQDSLNTKENEIKSLIEKTKQYQDESVNNTKEESEELFNYNLKLPDNTFTTIPIRNDGYINDTLLCKAGGKKFNDWSRLQNTIELLTALESEVGISITQLIDVKKGNSSKFQQGSWIHPDLAIQLAQWISPRFSIQVSRWMREMRLQLEEKNKVSETKEKEKEKEMKTLIEETKQSQNSCLNTKEEKLTNGLFNCSLKLLDNSCMTIPMREDGYVNVTLLCKAGGKDIRKWRENKSSVYVLNASFSLTGIPVSQLLNSTRIGKTQNTFAHPDIAIQIAQWVDPYFAIQVSRWTKELTMQIQEKNKVLESKDNKTEIEQSQDSLTTKQQNKTNFEQSSDIVEFKLTLKNNTELSIPVSKDGYVNVTKLCKAGGKEYKHWKANKESEAVIKAIERSVGIPTDLIIRDIRTGKNESRGTFVHRRLALIIAQWISPDFAVQVAAWTEELLLFGSVILGNEKSSEELDNKFQEQINQLTQEKELLEQVLETKDQDIKILQIDLLQEQKDVISTKKSLMKTQTKFSQRHKFTDASCVYILQDPDCKYSKLKIGLTTDINQRLTSDRTMIPNIKVRYIMYNDHCELFEKAIKVRCKENLELPSHEWVFESLDNLIKIYNEIDKSNGFSSIIETDLWRYNLEPPPSEEYQESEPVNIPTYYGTPISKISNFLSGPQLIRGDYLIKNNNAPQGQRWCNGWCQCYKMVTDFAKRSVSPMTICIYCENMLDVAIIKVKSGLLTEKEIRKDPSKILLESNQQICRKCETIKHSNDFDEKKRQCKQCRNKVKNKFKENFDDIVESEVKTLRSLGKYERDKRLDSNYNRDQLFMISSVCKTGRRESDTKKIILENLIKYFDTKDLA